MLFTVGLHLCLMLVGKLDENIFQARRERANLRHDDALFQQIGTKSFEIKAIVDQPMDRLPENRGAANSGKSSYSAQRAGNFRRRNFHANRALWLNFGKLAQSIWRAVRDQLTVVDVGNVAAALGFVHVVRRDKKG